MILYLVRLWLHVTKRQTHCGLFFRGEQPRVGASGTQCTSDCHPKCVAFILVLGGLWSPWPQTHGTVYFHEVSLGWWFSSDLLPLCLSCRFRFSGENLGCLSFGPGHGQMSIPQSQNHERVGMNKRCFVPHILEDSFQKWRIYVDSTIRSWTRVFGRKGGKERQLAFSRKLPCRLTRKQWLPRHGGLTQVLSAFTLAPAQLF